MLLPDLFDRCVRNWSDKTAFVSGDTRRTWAEMDRRSDRLARALQDRGIGKGDVVATLGHERIEKPEIILACLKIGAVRTGVNWRYAPREMSHILRDSNARVVFVQANCTEKLDSIRRDIEADQRLLVGFGEDHGLRVDYETFLNESDAGLDRPDHDPGDRAQIIYTSGTTGDPKGAELTYRNITESLLHGVLSSGLEHEDVWLNVTPHAGITFLYTLLGTMNGMTTVLPDGDFKAEAFLRLVEQHAVTASVLVVTAMRRVTEKQKDMGVDLSSFRLLAYGSETATQAVLRSAKDVLNCRLQQFYGMTESCAPWSSLLMDEDHRRGLNEDPQLLESCGKPNLFTEMTILDEDGEPLPPEETGEIAIRSDTVMQGYHRLPDETDRVFEGDWLRTGDVGYYDEAGYFYLVDRKDFLIMSGAMKVYPSAVENVIDEHPGVREVAVVGAPHPEWGEAVVAHVIRREDAMFSVDDLKEFCRDELADFEIPKFIKFVNELPHGVTGKLDRHTLQERYEEQPDLLPWHEGAES